MKVDGRTGTRTTSSVPGKEWRENTAVMAAANARVTTARFTSRSRRASPPTRNPAGTAERAPRRTRIGNGIRVSMLTLIQSTTHTEMAANANGHSISRPARPNSIPTDRASRACTTPNVISNGHVPGATRPAIPTAASRTVGTARRRTCSGLSTDVAPAELASLTLHRLVVQRASLHVSFRWDHSRAAEMARKEMVGR